jgi:hypothetical protein
MSNGSKEKGVFTNTTTTITIVDRARRQAEEHPDRRLLRWIDAQCNVAAELTYRQLWDGAGVGALVLVERVTANLSFLFTHSHTSIFISKIIFLQWRVRSGPRGLCRAIASWWPIRRAWTLWSACLAVCVWAPLRAASIRPIHKKGRPPFIRPVPPADARCGRHGRSDEQYVPSPPETSRFARPQDNGEMDYDRRRCLV